MSLFRFGLFLIVSSTLIGTSSAYACDKAEAKQFLQIPFDTVGLRSMTQVEAVRSILGCGNEADGAFAQAFREVTGEELAAFASRAGGSAISFGSGSMNWDDLTPEVELVQKSLDFQITNHNIEVIQVPVDYDDVEIVEQNTAHPSIKLNFSSDQENASNLESYVRQYHQQEEGNLVAIENRSRNGYCVRITRGFEFRMSGICLLKILVILPKDSQTLIIDKNGMRVNDSELPISKSEFFSALKNVGAGKEINVVRQFMQNRNVGVMLSYDDAMAVLSEVGISDETEAFRLIYPAISKPLSSGFVLQVMDEVSISDEFDVLQLMANDIQTPLAPSDLGRILDEIGISDELETFKLLAPKVAREKRMELIDVIDRELDEKKATRFLMGLQ